MNPATFAHDCRLARLFGTPSGRALIIAWAHGPLLGPIPGVAASDIARLGATLCGADGLLVTPAMMPGLVGALSVRDRPIILMLAHWQNISRPSDLLGYAEGASTPMVTVEQAHRWGADGVMTYLHLGWSDPRDEARNVEYVREVSEQCQAAGLLHVVESRALRDEFDEDGLARPEFVRLHTRLAAELGADVIKTKFTGKESFRTIVSESPVPIMTAGGPKLGPIEAALGDAEEVLSTGAAGLVWGRNIYQDANPSSALQAVLRLVHAPAS